MLAGLSLGHRIGGLLAQRTGRIGVHVGITLTLGALSTLAVLPLARLLAPLAPGRPPEVVLQIAARSGRPVPVPATCAGVVSPLLTRLALTPGRNSRTRLRRTCDSTRRCGRA